MFQIKLETMDLEVADFAQFLAENNINATRTGVIYEQPGGGEDVIYTADSKETLLDMIDQYWGGLDQFDFTIDEIPNA